jgi:hypothetical protein
MERCSVGRRHQIAQYEKLMGNRKAKKCVDKEKAIIRKRTEEPYEEEEGVEE